jgi:REP element-mobilizing transposase RayT
MRKFIERQAGGTYFYSSCVAGKKNLFVNQVYLDLMVRNLKEVSNDMNVKNLGYLIMPNHFYWLFKLPKEQDNPVKVYGELKKRVSFEILDNLRAEAKKEEKQPMVELFEKNEKVNRSHARRIIWFFKEEAKKLNNEKKMKMWDEDSMVSLVKTDEFLQKIMNILKGGPVKERWQLVKKAEDYPYLFLAPKLSL